MEENFVDSVKSNMSSMSKLLSKFTPQVTKASSKKRGGLNEITDLRTQTATMLGISFGRVSKMTTNWDRAQLYDTLQACKKFVNPPALWWKLYKKNKDYYGKEKIRKKVNTRAVPRMGKAGRKEDVSIRQRALF